MTGGCRPLTITVSSLVHRDVGGVQAGHGLGVLHSHHEDDADSHESEAGEDGDQDDEDGGDHHLPLTLALATRVGDNKLGPRLPQCKGVKGQWLTDPFTIGRPNCDHISVTWGEAGHQPLRLTRLQGKQTITSLGISDLESEQLS